jgi:hypothetical protein
MSGTQAFEVVATGPFFKRKKSNKADWRAVLLRAKSEDGKEGAFLVGLQVSTGDGKSFVRGMRLTKTRHLTHAARIFCDYILDQALKEDLLHEGPLRDLSAFDQALSG